MPKLAIIADDLTGANDSGVQFAKQGFQTISLLDSRHAEYGRDADVWVLNAETRSLDAEQAYAKITEICSSLSLSRIPYIYKKIDSTMRGNIGAEIDALMDQVHFDLAVVIPAYPGNSRVTIGGYHLVNQMLLEDSEIARDPKSPVRQSHLPTMLSSQSKHAVGHIELMVVRQPQRLADELKRQKAEGKQIIVFDSYAQHDLQAVTQTLVDSGLRILWVGSAGLACSLSEVLSRGERSQPLRSALESDSQAPILVVAGSVSAVTNEQITVLGERAQFAIIAADPLALLDTDKRPQEMRRLIDRAVALIDEGKSPILTTDTSDLARRGVEDWITRTHTEALAAGNLLADCLGQLGAAIVAERTLCGFVLTGGDIAYRTCLHLDVKALQIVEEVEEGIPLSVAIGGPADHLPVVTKAGAFGQRFSLVHAVEKIQEKTRVEQGG
ncbi:four-carbon acid sugar kinase family protein [Brevibacillus humidisoli]|uniref:four-carbon acid sugar kinase family protein n=1 Tax=Brevibacillus humidisoli TaxID=2895522 RepID=UPI001E473366|nr:four-carbon acid sugar kinase family protein [Brevibacillus humidisoli]UFJ41406.1 four-carbon acid sugar kinase family protein [Brevibacillus humidisoli]